MKKEVSASLQYDNGAFCAFLMLSTDGGSDTFKEEV
jgi:hypothetical protein